ncbi:MAG: glutamine amidotransferase [Steroidobacteraceae bacterium]
MFEFLFKYPAGEFRFGDLIYLRDWPIGALLALWLVGAVLLLLLAWRRGRILNVPRMLAISALQLAMWALVLWVMWQPALLIKSLRTGENTVAVMLDASASMSVPDADTTRMQQAQGVLANKEFTDLGKDYQLRRYAFARNAQKLEGKLDDFATLPEPGLATKIGDSVLQVLNASRTTPLGAVVLLSDGSDNAGQLDPAQLNEISRFGVPVHVIGIGREQMPEDVELDSVLAPVKTLPGSKLAARVAVRHDGAGTARIRVSDGDKLLAAKEIPLSKDTTLTTAWVEFDMNDSGYRDLKFALAGPEKERELRNNSRTQLVNVATDVAPVLYMEGEPRWEYKFMRRALDPDKSLRLVSIVRTTTNGLYRQGVENPDELKDGFPRTREELFKYDALVLGNVQAAYFTKVQQQLIQEFVNLRGGSLLLLGGSKSLGEGGWGNTVVNDVLPVKLPETKNSFHRVMAQAAVTPRGQRESWLKFSDEVADNAKQWNTLPMLADYQDLGPLKPAAATLMTVKIQNKEQPLLVTQSYGRGHASIFATGGTWRWQMSMPLEDQHHEAFWRQMMRGLVTDVPKQVEFVATSQGDDIRIRATLRDKSFQPERDLQVTAVTTLPSGYTENLTLKPVTDQPGVYEASFAPDASGTFFIEYAGAAR